MVQEPWLYVTLKEGNLGQQKKAQIMPFYQSFHTLSKHTK